MSRSLGSEVITTVVILGFIIGLVLFMYWSTKRELSVTLKDNDVLRRKMQEAYGESRISLYKKNLMLSDLNQLKEENSERQRTILRLNLEVKNLQSKLVS